MAILTFVPLVVSAWASVIERPLPAAEIGIVGTVMCMVTVYCTAMIYASLKSVQAWNTQADAALLPAVFHCRRFSGGQLFCL